MGDLKSRSEVQKDIAQISKFVPSTERGMFVQLFCTPLVGRLCLSGIDSTLKLLYDGCWIIGAEDGCSSDNDVTT